MDEYSDQLWSLPATIGNKVFCSMQLFDFKEFPLVIKLNKGNFRVSSDTQVASPILLVSAGGEQKTQGEGE